MSEPKPYRRDDTKANRLEQAGKELKRLGDCIRELGEVTKQLSQIEKDQRVLQGATG